MDETREKGTPVFRYDRNDRLNRMDPDVRKQFGASGGRKKRWIFGSKTTLIILVDILIITLVFLFVSPLIRRTMAGERQIGAYSITAEAFYFAQVTRVRVVLTPTEGAEPVDMEIVLTGSPGGVTTRETLSVTPPEAESYRASFEGRLSSVIVRASVGDEALEWKIPVRDDEE